MPFWENKSVIENIKVSFEILAYFAAAAFFLYKAISGIWYVSLSLGIDCNKRYKLNQDEDIIIVSLTLTAGENAALNIHEVQGRVTYNGISREFSFDGIERLKIDINKNELNLAIPWMVYKEHYRASIKESTTFTETLVVPNNVLCKIEATVVGSRKKIIIKTPTISQWRISQFSIPSILQKV